jgi:hypothetical protein
VKHEVAIVWASKTKTRSWKLIVVTDKNIVASSQTDGIIYAAICQAKNVIIHCVEIEYFFFLFSQAITCRAKTELSQLSTIAAR